MDIDNAFLHDDMEEQVYMKLPLGFQVKNANIVCRMKKLIV